MKSDMIRFFSYLFFLTSGVLLLCTACTDEQMPDTNGYLSVTRVQIQTVIESVARSTDDENLTVDLYRGGEKLRTLSPEEMADKIKLDAADDYSLRVYSSNYGQDAQWTNADLGEPIYFIEVPFQVKSGETTPLDVKVPMSCFAVSFTFDQPQWIDSYTFTVTSGERSVQLTTGQTAYFTYHQGGTFEYTFQLTNADAEDFNIRGIWGTQPDAPLAANTCYSITYLPPSQALNISR